MAEAQTYYLGDATPELTHDGIAEAVVTHRKTGEKVKLIYNFGENLEAAIEKFGEKVVFSNAVVGMKTALRNKLYSSIAGVPKDAEEEEIEKLPSTESVVTELQSWKPSEAGTRERVDSIEAMAKKLESMTPEAKQKEVDRLKALLGL